MSLNTLRRLAYLAAAVIGVAAALTTTLGGGLCAATIICGAVSLIWGASTRLAVAAAGTAWVGAAIGGTTGDAIAICALASSAWIETRSWTLFGLYQPISIVTQTWAGDLAARARSGWHLVGAYITNELGMDLEAVVEAAGELQAQWIREIVDDIPPHEISKIQNLQRHLVGLPK